MIVMDADPKRGTLCLAKGNNFDYERVKRKIFVQVVRSCRSSRVVRGGRGCLCRFVGRDERAASGKQQSRIKNAIDKEGRNVVYQRKRRERFLLLPNRPAVVTVWGERIY